MSRKYKTLQDFAQQSLTVVKSKSVGCKVELYVDGKTWNAYEVSIAHQELMFFCNEGVAIYMVDNYSGEARCELYDWEYNEDAG